MGLGECASRVPALLKMTTRAGRVAIGAGGMGNLLLQRFVHRE